MTSNFQTSNVLFQKLNSMIILYFTK